MRRLPSGVAGAALVFGAFALGAACASSEHAPSSPTAPAPVRAFRYLTPVMTERWCYDIAEIHLPEQHLVCNVSSEFASDGSLETRPVARAFFHKTARNRDRDGHERPTERYQLPPDLVEDMVELARLTARQREQAERVGARLVPLVPLDSYHEFACLLRELQQARTMGADSAKLDELEARSDRIREGTITDNQEQRYRDIRNELAVLVQRSR